jgi:hypothetical protein
MQGSGTDGVLETSMIKKNKGGFAMIELSHENAGTKRDNLAFTNTARSSMQKLYAREETIEACIANPDGVTPAFARNPGETVMQITRLDLHVIYNETEQLVLDVKQNRDYIPNDPMVIERGHPEDRGILRDLYLGLSRQLPDSSGTGASVQRLRNRARSGRWFPPFEIRSRTLDGRTWLGRQG